MASTVSVPSAAVTCRLRVIVATSRPATVTSTFVFGAALAARVMLGRPTSATRPLVIPEVPVTVPVFVSKVHDDVTAEARTAATAVRGASTVAMVDDASVASAVSVITPVVSRPATLTLATVAGEVPGKLAGATGARVISPVAAAPSDWLGPAAAAGPAVARMAPSPRDADGAA